MKKLAAIGLVMAMISSEADAYIKRNSWVARVRFNNNSEQDPENPRRIWNGIVVGPQLVLTVNYHNESGERVFLGSNLHELEELKVVDVNKACIDVGNKGWEILTVECQRLKPLGLRHIDLGDDLSGRDVRTIVWATDGSLEEVPLTVYPCDGDEDYINDCSKNRTTNQTNIASPLTVTEGRKTKAIGILIDEFEPEFAFTRFRADDVACITDQVKKQKRPTHFWFRCVFQQMVCKFILNWLPFC